LDKIEKEKKADEDYMIEDTTPKRHKKPTVV
jgi:hypothetical protein